MMYFKSITDFFNNNRINYNTRKMKKAVCLLFSLFLFHNALISNDNYSVSYQAGKDTIKVLADQDLFTLSSVFAAEYNRLNTGTLVAVEKISSGNSAEFSLKSNDIGIVGGNEIRMMEGNSLYTTVAGRDIIVPVINENNPFLSVLNEKGISPVALGNLLTSSDVPRWGKLLANDARDEVKVYLLNNKSMSENISGFLSTGNKPVTCIEVQTSRELIDAVKNNPMAIAFCSLVSIVDFQKQTLTANLKLLPIDRNNNGILESNEDIYSDLNAFTRGVWIGKYPKTLINNVYTVSALTPQNEGATAFVKWILSDGQQYLNGIGYTDLLASERLSAIDKLLNAQIQPVVTGSKTSVFKSLFIIFIVLMVLVLTVDLVLRYFRGRKALISPVVNTVKEVLNEKTIIIPKGLYFDKTHTWAFMEQSGVVKVGIDDFLQHVTGAITRIKMKKTGEEVKKGDIILSVIHNGKQLNLYAPISGTILEHNSILEVNSSLINTSPYSEGWIYRIEPTNWVKENQLLFMAEKQKQFIVKEFSRLKDFLSSSLQGESNMYATVILQDGGELSDAPLSELGPEVWEDFQTKFIDSSRQLWFYEMY